MAPPPQQHLPNSSNRARANSNSNTTTTTTTATTTATAANAAAGSAASGKKSAHPPPAPQRLHSKHPQAAAHNHHSQPPSHDQLAAAAAAARNRPLPQVPNGASGASSNTSAKRKSLIQLPPHLDPSAASHHPMPVNPTALAAASSSSSSRVSSKNAVERWLRDTPLPVPAPEAAATQGDRRASVIGGQSMAMLNEAGNRSMSKLGSSPSSAVPPFLMQHSLSFVGSTSSSLDFDGVLSDRATNISDHASVRKGDAKQQHQNRRSIYTNITERAPMSTEPASMANQDDDQPLALVAAGEKKKQRPRMSAYISKKSFDSADNQNAPAATNAAAATSVNAPAGATSATVAPAAEPVTPYAPPQSLEKNPMDSYAESLANDEQNAFPPRKDSQGASKVPPPALSVLPPQTQQQQQHSTTESPTEVHMTEGRQMLGENYAESTASEAEEIIPPKILLARQHRNSLVPSLHSGDDSDGEHRFSFGGDTSTLDGGSSDVSDSEMGSINSQALAAVPLPERMEMMKLRVKKSKDKFHAFEAARFIVDNVQFLDKSEQKANCELAIKQLKKLSIAGLVDAQYLLANLYISGIPGFQEKHKADYSKAFNLYSSAAKKDHPEALFHVGLCYEQGAGVAQSNNRALHNYRKAAVSNHPGAMFRLGMCLLRGELNQSKNPRDGVKWLKLAAKYATEKYPQALYELALLHDHGVHNVVWPDHEYLIELLTQGAGLGHGGCQFKLGEAFEYGYFGVVVDPGRSVYYYSLAAANGNLEAMFELGGWYLTGASDPNTTFTLIQSDAEAHRWVSLAADGGLPKAMFAMGYFCEMGIGRGEGVQPDAVAALDWYERAAAKGDSKARSKVREMKMGSGQRGKRRSMGPKGGGARKPSAASGTMGAAAAATSGHGAPQQQSTSSSGPHHQQSQNHQHQQPQQQDLQAPQQQHQPQARQQNRAPPLNVAEADAASSSPREGARPDKKKKKSKGCTIM
ncbi:hypothetical protein HDU86_004168 [Geranomyces michiganensis]|nr:hypothetical protein HDU86_004168 [Geranomyces michiganensis]